jgi:hypothetical protein
LKEKFEKLAELKKEEFSVYLEKVEIPKSEIELYTKNQTDFLNRKIFTLFDEIEIDRKKFSKRNEIDNFLQ